MLLRPESMLEILTLMLMFTLSSAPLDGRFPAKSPFIGRLQLMRRSSGGSDSAIKPGVSAFRRVANQSSYLS
jgi:hypothetical protein